jgi:hypothetical protein
MSVFKLQTLKQRIVAIFLFTALIRVTVFLFFPKLVYTDIAPDEGMYASLAKWLGESKPVDQFPGYGDIVYRQGKAFVLPASLLYRVGINELDSIRIISSLYGLGSLLIVSIFAIKYLAINSNQKLEVFRNKLLLLTIAIYALIPSHFLWSILGLRESSVEFWTLLTFLSIYMISKNIKWKLVLWTSAGILGLSMVFNSRPQVGWLLFSSLILSSVITRKSTKLVVVLTSVVLGLFAGNLINGTYTLSNKSDFVAASIDDKQVLPNLIDDKQVLPNLIDDKQVLPNLEVQELCFTEKQIVIFETKKYECIQKKKSFDIDGFSNPGNVVLNNIEGISSAQVVRKTGAASEIQAFPCPLIENSRIANLACIAIRAPYMSFTFLTRPLIFVDTTSFVSYFAAAENILWLIGLLLLLFGAIKFRGILSSKEALPPLIFMVTYVIGAGSYQGNLGTAFRHKSLILWVLLLCAYKVGLAISQDRDKREPRNNSQERAV